MEQVIMEVAAIMEGAAGISGVLEKKLKVRAGSTEVIFKSSITSSSDANLKSISDLLQRSMTGYPLTSPVQAPSNPPPLRPPDPAALPTGSTNSSGSRSCMLSARS